MIYFAFFGLSLLLSVFSERLFRLEKSGWLVFAITSVALVSLLNGIRDYSIGTDVLVYGNNVFIMSYSTNSLPSYFEYCDMLGMHEYGYALLNWVVSRFTHSPHVFYFLLGLLTNGLAYAAACAMRKQVSVTWVWLTYLLMFFPTSLNMLRQGLAIVMIAYAFLKLGRHGLKWYVLWVVAAYFIHQSAVVAICFYPYYAALQKQVNQLEEGRVAYNRTLVYVVVFTALVALIPLSLGILRNNGLLPDKYIQYANANNLERDLQKPILIRLPFVLLSIWILFNKRFKSIDARNLCLATFIMCEFVLLPLQSVSLAAFRIGLYFGIFKIAAYPLMLRQLGVPHWVSSQLYFVFVVFIFCYQVIYSGNGEVYPFVVAVDLFR